MSKFACGYCHHVFESEESPRECPNCGKYYGPFYFVFSLDFSKEEVEEIGEDNIIGFTVTLAISAFEEVEK